MRFRCGIALFAAAALAVCSGCGGGGGGASYTSLTPPVVTGTALSPTYLFSAGGNVTISAQVTGDGISQVRATVTLPDTSTASVTMSGSGGSYSGTYTAPANATESVQTYSVRVRATNTGGISADGASVVFGVLNGEAPPLPPPPTTP